IVEAFSRLSHYVALSCTALEEKLNCIVAALLNMLLVAPSLKNPYVMKLYDSLCRRLAEKTRIIFYGYTVKPVDCEGMVVFHPGYESEITRILLGLLEPGNVFIDIGAHLGRYTLLAARRVGLKGLIVALEPM
ncbi:MAG: hypothetical protein ABWW69_03895, partial [Pyrodictiaceae archaeon]